MYSNNLQLVTGLGACGVLSTPNIKEAFLAVDRKNFVTDENLDSVYLDDALPIGFGQTISQPYTVAFMLELLSPQPGELILDVGSGSGWTTALLAHIVGSEGRVFGVELIPELVQFGQENLGKYEFEQADIRQATGDLGLPEEAPFDKILVSAAGGSVPKELVAQLRVGGVMVIPVGASIWRVVKTTDQDTETEKHSGFSFVPLIH